MMEDKFLRLKQISETLLFEEEFGKLNSASTKLYDFLCEIVGEIGKEETILPTGKAISAEFAARCVLDFARTSKFLRGLRLAIIEAKRRFPNEKITILYAGCGPFATLAIPLCTQFSADEISFTLVDIHQKTLDSARRVFQHFGLENYAAEFIRTDAATFQAEEKFHVAVTETMQKALEKEPQVAITLNLAKQLKDNGVFVPEKISIEVCLVDLAKEFEPNVERERIYLSKIMELTKETTECLPVKINIPNENHKQFAVALLTKIYTFDSIMLDDYDSGLTYPTILHDLDKSFFGKELTFEYMFGKNPKFNYYQS
jgi:predicted RNA methylase